MKKMVIFYCLFCLMFLSSIAFSATITLVTLHCTETEDNTGSDEPYLKRNGQIIWGPGSLNNNQDSPVGVSFDTNTNAVVELFDQDTGFMDSDDFLGSATLAVAPLPR